jgi:hypothetical protein
MDSPDRRPASNEVQRVRSCSPTFRSVALVTALGAATVALSAAPAASAWSGRLRAVTAHLTAAAPAVIGRDISFPQCGGPLPAERTAAFGILGANGGKTFTRNPCLVAELAWAKRLEAPPAFYANTGNPGPKRATHWPIGQTAPKVCSARDPNSLGCSYDYGWNAAWHAYTAATDAAQRLHRVDRVNARHRAANVDWWLDVETMNSWQTIDGTATRAAKERDVAALNGEIDAFRIAGVERVGVYSTAHQWLQITGGTKINKHRFAGAPVWLAGYTSRADAIAGCADRSFTGGPVAMTQYLGADGFDANVLCSEVGDA